MNPFTQVVLMYFGVAILSALVSWVGVPACPATLAQRTDDNRHAARMWGHRS